jgi:hypothetical protein
MGGQVDVETALAMMLHFDPSRKKLLGNCRVCRRPEREAPEEKTSIQGRS